MIPGTFQETLKCLLTEDEVRERAGRLAIVQKEIEDNIEEAKDVADNLKRKRKVFELQRATLAREVRDQATFRQVDCVERLNGEGMIETIRKDTGEVLNSRPATPGERQQEFFSNPDA